MLNPDTGLDYDDINADALDPLDGFPVIDGEHQADPDDPLAQAAAIAFGHIVDDLATVADLEAYRAWIVSLRLDGWTEDELASSVAVAEHLAAKLGV
jgi:hypothetical protein